VCGRTIAECGDAGGVVLSSDIFSATELLPGVDGPRCCCEEFDRLCCGATDRRCCTPLVLTKFGNRIVMGNVFEFEEGKRARFLWIGKIVFSSFQHERTSPV
jgi:hypothetical protein